MKCNNEKEADEGVGYAMFGCDLVHSWLGSLGGANRFSEQKPSQQWSSKSVR